MNGAHVTKRRGRVANNFRLRFVELGNRSRRLVRQDPVRNAELFILSSLCLCIDGRLSLYRTLAVYRATRFLRYRDRLAVVALQVSRLSSEMILRTFRRVFFRLSREGVYHVMLLAGGSLWILTGDIMAARDYDLCFSTRLLFRVFGRSIMSLRGNSLDLRASLRRLLSIYYDGSHASFVGGSVDQLCERRRALRLTVHGRYLAALTVRSTLADIPRVKNA